MGICYEDENMLMLLIKIGIGGSINTVCNLQYLE